MIRRFFEVVIIVITITSGIVLLSAAVLSLNWRYEHDSPLMIYAGWLVKNGAIPYRDFFDMNMPGTYFIMTLMGLIFGWTDLSFRIFDLIILAGISGFTFLWMRRFGKWSALIAAITFPLWYLHEGPMMSMQREYIALLPLGAMLTAASLNKYKYVISTSFVIGFLAGIIALIKPQFLLFIIPVSILILKHQSDKPRIRRKIIALAGGIFLPLFAAFLYLLFTGGLVPFFDIALNYWPLYTHMTHGHMPISGFNRLLYIVKSTIHGLINYYTVAAIAGLVVLKIQREQSHWFRTLVFLLIAAAILPALSGQFWDYHWIPFFYFALCTASLSVHALSIKKLNFLKALPIVVLIIYIYIISIKTASEIYTSFTKRTSWNANDHPKLGVPDDVARFLNAHLKEGDTVQPLDWTGGAVHGMLIARAPLATRFIYDFHFYHHINEPYIKSLRSEFMRELYAAKPQFIIRVFDNKPWPRGENTTRKFPELTAFIAHNYTEALNGSTFTIFEKKGQIP